MKKIILAMLLMAFFSDSFAGEWFYSQNKDEMRGVVSYAATLDSDSETMHANSSNGGEVLQIITLSDDDKVSKKAGIRLTQGAFLCQSNEFCKVNVKFDGGDVEELYAKLAGGSNDVMAIVDASSFVQKMKLSKVVYIEVPIYKGGASQFKFLPDELKWQGIEANKPFLSSIGSFDLLQKQQWVGGLKVQDVGEGCYTIKGFKIHKNLDAVGDANVCTFNGMIHLVNVKYPYKRSTLNGIFKTINKELGTNNDESYPMWLSDGTSGVSSILLLSHKNKDISFSFTFNPVASQVPPSEK